MNLTDDLKQQKFEDTISRLFLKYHPSIEQITLDFLESVDYKLENKDKSVFDFELILIEIKAEAKKLINFNFDGKDDLVLLNEILKIEYKDL